MHPARAGCVRVSLPIVSWVSGRPLSSIDPNHHLAIVNAAFAARNGRAITIKWLRLNVAATARRNGIDANVVDLDGCVEGMKILAMASDRKR